MRSLTKDLHVNFFHDILNDLHCFEWDYLCFLGGSSSVFVYEILIFSSIYFLKEESQEYSNGISRFFKYFFLSKFQMKDYLSVRKNKLINILVFLVFFCKANWLWLICGGGCALNKNQIKTVTQRIILWLIWGAVLSYWLNTAQCLIVISQR